MPGRRATSIAVRRTRDERGADVVLAYSGELLVLRVEVRAAAATRRRPLLLSAARRTCLPRRRPLTGRGGQLGERQAGGAPAGPPP